MNIISSLAIDESAIEQIPTAQENIEGVMNNNLNDETIPSSNSVEPLSVPHMPPEQASFTATPEQPWSSCSNSLTFIIYA